MHQAPPEEGDVSGSPVRGGRAEVRAVPRPCHVLGTQASPGLGSEQEGPLGDPASVRQCGWRRSLCGVILTLSPSMVASP